MRERIPREFPKVWPFAPAFVDHPRRAKELYGQPTSLCHVFEFLSKPLMLFGLLGFVIPFGFFGFSLLAGIFMWVASAPFVSRVNRQQKEAFRSLMDETAAQVARERVQLQQAARAEVSIHCTEDEENQSTLEQHAKRHYTPNWEWVRRKLLIRDSYRCCACNQPVQLASSVAHHVFPFSEGGLTRFDNLVTICVDCHSRIHPWLDSKLNFFWITQERGQVYCWKCKKRLDSKKENVVICSDCGWLHHVDDGACGCNCPSTRC